MALGKQPHLAMWSSDFEIAPGEWFGDWLRAEIAENAFLERHGFMPGEAREMRLVRPALAQ
jgi:hypothetical protein